MNNDYGWDLSTKKNDYLAHHGVLGQKWGVRRYQRPDGSLTEAGKKRLREYARSYSNTYYAKGKNKKNRQQAEDDYDKEYWKVVNKANGGKQFRGDGTEAAELIGIKKDQDMWKNYLKSYGDAAVKDLGIENSKQVKDFLNNDVFKEEYAQIKKILRDEGY